MYTIDDIEIFIMTYNRADYLKASIESILNQTANVKNITVLDNNSSDNTEQVVLGYENRGVEYIKTFGFLGNFNKAKEVVSKKYCMLFHDDDILSPQYLDLALKILNRHENVAIIVTKHTEFTDKIQPIIKNKISEKHYLFKNKKEFAKYVYFIAELTYATAIYKTENFRATPLNYSVFNKVNDRPFMVETTRNGCAILIDDKSVFFVRRHDGQDTTTSINTPTLCQIINYNKYFFNVLELKNCKYSALQLLYNEQCAYLMQLMYESFISKQEKNACSLDCFEKLAIKNELFISFKKQELSSVQKNIYRKRSALIRSRICSTCFDHINKVAVNDRLAPINKKNIHYPKLLIKILCCFVPGKKNRDHIRSKYCN